MKEENFKKNENRCSLQEIVTVIGGKWSMSIIYGLLNYGKKRFSELERMIPGISTRMLVKELKNMEANGILTRTVYATVPPTVEYELTTKGKKLQATIDEMYKWGEEYIISDN